MMQCNGRPNISIRIRFRGDSRAITPQRNNYPRILFWWWGEEFFVFRAGIEFRLRFGGGEADPSAKKYDRHPQEQQNGGRRSSGRGRRSVLIPLMQFPAGG